MLQYIYIIKNFFQKNTYERIDTHAALCYPNATQRNATQGRSLPFFNNLIEYLGTQLFIKEGRVSFCV